MRYRYSTMADTSSKVEKADDEDKSEVLGNLVKVVVLIWSASLLTFSYVRLPNGQKILDFDPTFYRIGLFWIVKPCSDCLLLKRVVVTVKLLLKKNQKLFPLSAPKKDAKTN